MKTAVCVFLTVFAFVHGWTEKECNRPCFLINDPQCLTFQKTVPNDCVGQIEVCKSVSEDCVGQIEVCKMRAQGYTLTSSSNSSCACSPACTMESNPVCAVDLQVRNSLHWFPNPCTLDYHVCEGNTMGEVDMKYCPILNK